MRTPSLCVLLLGVAGVLPAQADGARSSKTPPVGAPWVTDFAQARAAAMAANVPIFVYSTKAHCPHCVVMEKGLLAATELAVDYDRVVWMYLYQDFSQSEADRRAERVAIRFGISSWPQHFLVDPYALQNLERHREAVGGGEGGDVAAAKQHLEHADRVVAFRALQLLAKKAPVEVARASARLLGVPNDQIRGLTCDVLAEHGEVESRDALHALVREPAPSENPNVMRMRATKALARCGDASSLAVIAPFATSGQYRNGLTTTSIQAVVAIAERVKKAKAEAVAILATAYPAVPAAADEAAEQRAREALAKTVHDVLQKLTGRRVAFPETYSEATRSKLVQAW